MTSKEARALLAATQPLSKKKFNPGPLPKPPVSSQVQEYQQHAAKVRKGIR